MYREVDAHSVRGVLGRVALHGPGLAFRGGDHQVDQETKSDILNFNIVPLKEFYFFVPPSWRRSSSGSETESDIFKILILSLLKEFNRFF
jgi:hypothetical protein